MKLKKLELPDKCRIIAISDVHTARELMAKVLKKAEYKPGEDYLIVVGDILERGSENIEMVRYAMEIAKVDRVFFTMGNNDTMVNRMASIDTYEKYQERMNFRPVNTFSQMAKELGITDFEHDFEKKRRMVASAYSKELEFMGSFPTAIATQKHIFVHAGIENRKDWENTSGIYALTTKWFLREENCSDKWVVVGHYPSYNYKEANNTNNPIIDTRKRMVCIDGGINVTDVNQLNAFIINKCGENYEYEFVCENSYEKKTVIRDFDLGITPVYIDCDNQNNDFIEEKDGFVHLKNNFTGESGWIIKSAVHFDSDMPRVYQRLSAFPKVKCGDEVSVCRESGGYCLIVIKDGFVGWIPTDVIQK